LCVTSEYTSASDGPANIFERRTVDFLATGSVLNQTTDPAKFF
jgi:hypothetical protein